MRTLKLLILLLGVFLTGTNIYAQANASLNILTLNSGYVSQGGIADIQVTVGNTGPVSSIGANKVRAQISVPSALVTLLPNIDQTGLPAGWSITVNTGSAITICNGSDVIAVGTSRDIFIKVQGNSIGGPSTVNGNLLFSSGTSCTTPGTLAGDNTADNSSTSSIQVYDPLPVKLIDFDAILINCNPVLKWVTENEINSDRFEIEKRQLSNGNWTSIAIVNAKGNSNSKNTYNYTDRSANTSTAKVFYRLKMIDKDGNFNYSSIIPININCNNVEVVAYPNPVQYNKLFINITGVNETTDAALLTLSGQVLMTIKLINGTNFFDVSTIANGAYLIHISGSKGPEKEMKVLITH